jgi:uncharacterized membrane protein YqiK
MSDNATPAETDTVTEPPVTTPTTPEPKPEPKPKDWESEAAKWKALARKHEDQSKANADKARQYDEITEAQKSELDKALERATKAEQQAAEIELRATRAEVASEKGVPVPLVTGANREEMEAAADAALAWRKTIPGPDFGGGRRGDDAGAKAKQLSREDMKRMSPEEIVSAQKKGLFDDLLKPSR